MSQQKTVTLSARVPIDFQQQVDELAKALGRERAWIVEKAVRQFVQTELQFSIAVQQGQGDIEAGRFIESDQMNAELDRIEAELSGHS
jgi:predicted transcriptional regulator